LNIKDKLLKFKNSKSHKDLWRKLIMTINKKIEELKIVLPEAKAPVGSYVATKIVGKLLLYQDKYQLMKKVN
jgi:hypothetical protein